MGKLAVSLVLPLTAQPNCRILHPLMSPEGVNVVDRQVRDSLPIRLLVSGALYGNGSATKPTQQDAQKGGFLTHPTPARRGALVPRARPQRMRGRGVPSGAHGATNKEHHVCARRRVSEAAGSPLRVRMMRERSWRTFSVSYSGVSCKIL